MIHLHVIGAGGIGSYFLEVLYDLTTKGQLPDIGKVIVYDPDEVEMKNTFYQNFKIDEIGLFKTEAIRLRYGFIESPIKVTNFESTIKFDGDIEQWLVSCVDNWQTREAMFTWYDKLVPAQKEKARWIDLRSHGNQIACYTNSKSNTLEKMKATLPKADAPVEEGANSCQNPFDLSVGKIQLGNRIIGTIGSQVLLNLTRKTPIGDKFELFI